MDQRAETFKKLMFSLIKKAKAHFELELRNAGIHITPLQYAILVHLGKKGITLNELSGLLANKPPTVVPALDHLEAEGYVKKTQDAKDRRKVKIVISSKGRDILKKVPIDRKSDLIKKGFGKLSKEKAEKLVSLLNELTENMDI